MSCSDAASRSRRRCRRAPLAPVAAQIERGSTCCRTESRATGRHRQPEYAMSRPPCVQAARRRSGPQAPRSGRRAPSGGHRGHAVRQPDVRGSPHPMQGRHPGPWSGAVRHAIAQPHRQPRQMRPGGAQRPPTGLVGRAVGRRGRSPALAGVLVALLLHERHQLVAGGSPTSSGLTGQHRSVVGAWRPGVDVHPLAPFAQRAKWRGDPSQSGLLSHTRSVPARLDRPLRPVCVPFCVPLRPVCVPQTAEQPRTRANPLPTEPQFSGSFARVRWSSGF